MEAVLTNGVDDISFRVRKGILPSKFQKGSRINIYIRICTEILFQLINEDSKSLFLNISITNERCESNQFQVEERIEYSLIKSFTPS